MHLLSSLLKLQDVSFQRSLWPDEEVIGPPSLVVFSDGSALAYGAVAYIRWQLRRGGYWTRLIMAKGKIAPKGMTSIPRMELNGAVVGNRIKNFLIKETNIQFGEVYQLVDSSTVLGYLQKECGNFRPYEGIRIAEIQTTAVWKDGKLVGVFWVPGEFNPADWCTKPRRVEDLMSWFWQCGPGFMQEDVSRWPIRSTYKKEGLEGELKIPRGVHAVIVNELGTLLNRLLSRYSSWIKVSRVWARIRRIVKVTPSDHIELEAGELKQAKIQLVKFAQQGIADELKDAVDNGKGRFRRLAPEVDGDGVYRVGSRLKNHVPFTLDHQLPVLLPPDHRITSLVMEEAHQFSHLGQDGTLGRFRASGYWTVRGGQLAKKVKQACIPCRKNSKRTLNQVMGDFPPEMHSDPVAWGVCQLDLTGPYKCRGDVNPRTTKKTWVMVVEDVNSGAVHMDIVQDYSAEAVLLAMRRFGALRGWPGKI